MPSRVAKQLIGRLDVRQGSHHQVSSSFDLSIRCVGLLQHLTSSGVFRIKSFADRNVECNGWLRACELQQQEPL